MENNDLSFFIEVLSKSLFNPLCPPLPAQMIKIIAIFDRIPNRKYEGWSLDWKRVYHFLTYTLQSKAICPHYTTKLVKNTFKSYIFKIVTKVKKAFVLDAGIEIFEALKQNLHPYKVEGLAYLCMLLPTHKHVPPNVVKHYFGDLMAFWYMVSGSVASNNIMMVIMSDIAHSHFEVDWTPYHSFIFTQIYRMLGLPFSPKMGDLADEINSVILKTDPISLAAKLVANIIRNGIALI
jgi:hypothetical protein